METKVRKGISPLWASRTVSLYVSWAVTGSVTYYCTQKLGLNAAVIGILFLVSKIFDAVTNFIAAYIVDNCHFKKGKGRPWDISVIPMWICIVLLYAIPSGWGMNAKYAMIFIYYTLINAVFGTILTCVDNIYFKHAILEENVRVKVQAFTGGVSMVAMTAVSIIMPMLITKFENVPGGWAKLATCFAVPCAILGMVRYLTVPEVDTEETSNETTHVSVKDTLNAFLTNKYVLIITLMFFAINAINIFNAAPAQYYFTYIVGDLSKQSVVSLISVLAIVSLVVTVPLANKFGKKKVLVGAFIISTAGCLMRFFAGDNMLILMVSGFISSIVTYPFSALSALMLIDSMDYSEWKNRKRVEGAVFAGSSLGSTIGTGVGSSLCGLVLNAFGFDGTAQIQSAKALLGIRVTYSIVPVILLLVVIIALVFYDLDDRMPQIHKDLEARAEEKETEATA